jgi:cytochrome c oxidase subunit 4
MSHEAANEHAHDHAAHGVGHVVSPKILIATALGLLVLTLITVFAAKIRFETVEMEELNIIVALGIAVVKATLVCLFFMHLRWDRPFNAFVLVGSLAFVALFITFAMTDSSEYKPEVQAYERTLPEGISPTIKAELDKLPPPLPEDQLPRSH